MSLAHSISTPPIRHGRVLSVELRQDAAVCVIADKTRLLLSRFLGSRVAVGDDIAYAVPTGDEVGTEILITKHAVTGPSRYLYHAPIGYVSQPKVDKRNQGEPSRDGQTFFARRVIAFSPELRRRRFRLALRRCEFYDGRALCR